MSQQVYTDRQGNFEIVYAAGSGIGCDTVEIAFAYHDVDRPDSLFRQVAYVWWHPPATLFGPLSGPLGKPLLEGNFRGGIDCEGRRFSATPIIAHGGVEVERVANDSLEIRVNLRGGDPNFSYDIEVFEAGDGCGSSSLARTGVRIDADARGHGEAVVTLPLPWHPSRHHVLGDGLGSEAFIVVLDWVDSPMGGDRFTTDPIPLPPAPAR